MTQFNSFWEGDCEICGSPIPRTDPEMSPCPNRYLSPHGREMQLLVLDELKKRGVDEADLKKPLKASIHNAAIAAARKRYAREEEQDDQRAVREGEKLDRPSEGRGTET